jgi:glutamine kinase
MNEALHSGKPILFEFSTKAGTLESLSQLVSQAHLCEQVTISVTDWSTDEKDIIDQIIERFSPHSLAIRSSAANEDGLTDSQAGVNLSLINVEPIKENIKKAICSVFTSYQNSSSDDQVLVQPMVADVAVSGVLLTRDLDTGSPYYVINYDDFSGRTDTVTSGVESKTVLVRRSSPDALRSARFRKLIACAQEIEAVTGHHELDIEFCINQDDQLYILQVRPLAARKNWTEIHDDTVNAALESVRDTIQNHMRPIPGLGGDSTIFGEMPDWNPAEMIGNTPRPLAFSLYRNLITDHIWAESRASMGYRRINQPLIVDFSGRPYVDVRLSLNSFLPSGIGQKLADKLINHQLVQLHTRRDLHDKIEFEIALTCWDFSFMDSRGQLLEAGFNGAEIDELEAGLKKITRNALKSRSGMMATDLASARRLLNGKTGKPAPSPLERVQEILDSCRKIGTLPFARLARHGFIGILFLRSLVNRGIFSPKDAEQFMRGIHTVASDVVADMHALEAGEISRDSFLGRYGHLRPGTYDILSERYDEQPDLYLGHGGREIATAIKPFEPTSAQIQAIDTLLGEASFDITADELLLYIVDAVKGREESKFAFTRCISDALVMIAGWGQNHGFSRDDLSFLKIDELLDGDIKHMGSVLPTRRSAYDLTRAIRLPHLIRGPEEIDVVRLPLGHPTFITMRAVTAAGMRLTAHDVLNIDNKIILIESADPGFDWVFSHDIKGLITCFGGTNSHMAIRCAEFGLPAAIGCGERLFDQLSASPVIELNCGARSVKSVEH